MSQALRTLLRELAEEAPAAVDGAVVRRGAERRRAGRLVAAIAAVAVAGGGAAVALQPGHARDELSPAPVAGEPLAPPADRAPLPDVVVAADDSRVAEFDRRTGSRTSWVSPAEPGKDISRLVLAGRVVLYELGGDDSRRVHLAPYPPQPDSGPAMLGEPGTFWPAATPDFGRYAMLATGDDAAYSPRVRDLRLIVTEADPGFGTQGVRLDAGWALGGLAFAGDSVVIATDGDLRVFTFVAELGTQDPQVRVLPAPDGCDWTLPTAMPDADQVLVLEKCPRDDGGNSDAVVVDVAIGQRVGTFATVLPPGPAQVDTLDLDESGQHLIAQVHGDGHGPGFITHELDDGRTVTTTQLVSPGWR